MLQNTRRVASRVGRVVRLFFTSELRWRAAALLLTLVVLLLAVNALIVVNSYIARNVMTALAERRAADFWPAAVLYIGVFGLATTAVSFQRFSEERLGLLWRNWMTDRLIHRYLENRAFVRIRARTDVDNPDERIAEDVKSFTTIALSLTVLTLNGLVTTLAFAGVAWSISPALFAAAAAYAAIGSAATVVLGRRLPGLNSNQLDREAEFRSELIHVREHAVAVAVTQSEAALETRLAARLAALVKNQFAIIRLNRNVNLFANGFNYLIPVVPLLVVGPLFMNGTVEFGVIAQSTVVFSQLVGAFALLIVEFPVASSFAAVSSRLDALIEAITTVPTNSGVQTAEAADQIVLNQVTLQATNEKKTLVEQLNATVEAERRLLVSGPNGEARSALFLALANLWEEGTGRIERPAGATMQFLSQQPYLVAGALREQFRAADPAGVSDDARIHAALEGAGLGELSARLGGLDVEQDWNGALPMVEKQALAVARVLFAKPRFAIIDEPSAALGPDAARVLEQFHSAKIGWVAFAAGDFNEAPADAVLTLADGGKWSIGPAMRPVEK